jgi:hypothetical protein
MREIAAHTVATLQYIPRREIGTSRHVAILDVIVNPLADRGHARQAVLDLAKFFPSKIAQFIRIAIPARQHVAEHGRRQLSGALGRGGGQAVVIRLRGNGDDGVVAEAISAGREYHARDGVSMAIKELLGGKILAQHERLEDDGVVAIRPWLQVEQKHGRARHFID